MSGYGQHFESMYTGSMVGMGADVFAVWGYVIAHRRNGMVELNPRLLCAMIGTTQEGIVAAIAKLCSPDPESRNPAEEGKRLIHEQAFTYRVISAEKYMALAMALNKRDSNAKRQAKLRESRSVTPRNAPSREVSHSDSDSDSDSDSKKKERESKSPRKRGSPTKHPLPEGFCLTAAMAEYARRKRGWSPERIVEVFDDFVGKSLARGYRYADWVKAWESWVRDEGKYDRPSGSHPVAPQDRGSQSSIAFQRQLERIRQLEAEEKAKAS